MSTKSQIEANIKANASKRENEKPRAEKVKKPTNPKNKRSNPRAQKRMANKAAGKKSAARGKYGIRIQLQKNGRTPNKALDYALRRNDKPLTFLQQEQILNDQHRKAAIFQSNTSWSQKGASPSTLASLRDVPGLSVVRHAERAKMFLHDHATNHMVYGRPADHEMRWAGVGDFGTNPRIVSGSFESEAEWEDSVNELSKLRPDIKNFVGHLVISLPTKTGRISPEKWSEIIDDARLGLDLDDSFPFVAVEHRDTEAAHVHLYFGRVSIDGKVHDQANLGFRASNVSEIIEQKHNLPLYDKPSDWDVKKPSKPELEKALRTGQASTRLTLQGVAQNAMTDCSSISQYLKKLELAGVGVEITTQENDTKISGMTLRKDGITMKASDLGKRFTAKGLSEKGIIYEKSRDFKVVQPLKKQSITQPESENQMIQAVDDHLPRSSEYVKNESNQRNVPNPTAAATSSTGAGVGVNSSHGAASPGDERNNSEHNQAIDRVGLEVNNSSPANESTNFTEQRVTGTGNSDSIEWPKPNKETNHGSDNVGDNGQRQSNILSVLAIADKARADAAAAANARANRNANLAAAQAKAAAPLTEEEKDAKRRAEKLEWIAMNGRNLKSKYCDSQYGALANLKLKAQQATNGLKEDEIDYKKLDEEVAVELMEAGFSESEIAQTILAKSALDYKSLDAIKLMIALMKTKKLATEHSAKVAAEQAANQQQENSYYRTPEPQ